MRNLLVVLLLVGMLVRQLHKRALRRDDGGKVFGVSFDVHRLRTHIDELLASLAAEHLKHADYFDVMRLCPALGDALFSDQFCEAAALAATVQRLYLHDPSFEDDCVSLHLFSHGNYMSVTTDTNFSVGKHYRAVVPLHVPADNTCRLITFASNSCMRVYDFQADQAVVFCSQGSSYAISKQEGEEPLLVATVRLYDNPRTNSVKEMQKMVYQALRNKLPVDDVLRALL